MPADPVPTPSAPPVAGPYSPAVRAGDWLVLAGQVGIDPATGKLVPGGTEAEARQVLANIGAVLADCGSGWHDVAKVNIFLVDMGEFPLVNAVYEAAIGRHRPARSTVAVVALPAGARVEIETWAHAPVLLTEEP
jgi:2-iminobutanoate/2-iminopropanoate deaminase